MTIMCVGIMITCYNSQTTKWLPAIWNYMHEQGGVEHVNGVWPVLLLKWENWPHTIDMYDFIYARGGLFYRILISDM